MKALLFVFLGGGLGSVVRFLIGKLNIIYTIPLGTLIVNILGSFLIGLILSYSSKHTNINKELILFLATGFCGGFTTFSTFAYENQNLLKTGDYVHFLLYTFGTFGLSLLAVVLGMFLTKS